MDPADPMTIVAGVVGVLLVGMALFQARQALRAARWPTVQGRVLSAELEDGPSMGRFIPVASYRAVVTYAYEVAGQEFTSKRVFFGDEVPQTGDGARDRVRTYSSGTVVQVWYDPRNPSSAVLEPYAAWTQTTTWLVLAALSVGAVFAVEYFTR